MGRRILPDPRRLMYLMYVAPPGLTATCAHPVTAYGTDPMIGYYYCPSLFEPTDHAYNRVGWPAVFAFWAGDYTLLFIIY